MELDIVVIYNISDKKIIKKYLKLLEAIRIIRNSLNR